jgi:hypothetical protein
LVRTHSACIWCWDKPRANSDSHDTPRPGFGRCHHHTPYSILCVRPQEWHPNGSFSRDSRSGVPKLSRFRLLVLWDFVAPRPNLRSGRGLNQTCSSRRELSNAMSHSQSARREQIDSQLLVVGSQTASLTPGPSFAHNLGCRCPNDQCEAILDIYTSRPFQWHQEHPKCEVFWALLLSSKHSGVPEDSKSPTLGVWVSSSHLAKVGLRHYHSFNIWSFLMISLSTKALNVFLNNNLFCICASRRNPRLVNVVINKSHEIMGLSMWGNVGSRGSNVWD